MNPMPYIKDNRSKAGHWEMRNNTQTRKLDATGLAEVKAAVERHNTRRITPAPKTPPTGATLRAQILTEVASEVKPLVSRLYRTASGRWAGGETSISIKIGTPDAAGGSETAYSDNGKWRGRNAWLSVSVQPAWRMYVRNAGIAAASGLLTTHAKLTAPNTWTATWIEQGRGFELHAVSGTIFKTTDGDFIHAASMAGVAQVLRKRAAAAKAAGAKPHVAAFLRTATANEIAALYGKVIVKRADSLKAGNCTTGTDSWINRHFPGRNSATIAELAPIYEAERESRLAAAMLIAILRA